MCREWYWIMPVLACLVICLRTFLLLCKKSRLKMRSWYLCLDSYRKPSIYGKSDFVNAGIATDPMVDFLSERIRYRIFICMAGAAGSGKTTVAGWLLTTIPHSKRIFTIENGSRERDFVREKEGKVYNSVIHTLTRFSENVNQKINQDVLLDFSLRFLPHVICVGEMRGPEAYTAQEISQTDHAVFLSLLILFNY